MNANFIGGPFCGLELAHMAATPLLFFHHATTPPHYELLQTEGLELKFSQTWTPGSAGYRLALDPRPTILDYHFYGYNQPHYKL